MLKRQWFWGPVSLLTSASLLLSMVFPATAVAASAPSLSQVTQDVQTLINDVQGAINDVKGIQQVTTLPSIVQNAPQLLTGDLSSTAGSAVGALANDMQQVDQGLSELASVEGPAAVSFMSTLGNTSLGFHSNGVSGWIDTTGGKQNLCLSIPGVALMGISNQSQLCGGIGSQLANPGNTLTAFVDFTPGEAGYIDARLPLDPLPGQLPSINARGYIPVANGHFVQVDFTTLANQSIQVDFGVKVAVSAADVVGGGFSASAKASFDVAPSDLQTLVDQGQLALQNWYQTNSSQVASGGVLTTQQAAAALEAVLQAVDASVTSSDTASLGVSYTGSVKLGEDSSGDGATINGASATAGVALSAPANHVVQAATSAVEDIISSGLGLSTEAQQFVYEELSGNSSAAETAAAQMQTTWRSDGTTLITDIVGSATNLEQVSKLHLTMSADLLGKSAATSPGGSTNESINLFSTSVAIPLNKLVNLAGQSSFWSDLGGALTGLFTQAVHAFDSSVPAGSLTPLTELGQSFNSVMAASSLGLDLNLGVVGTEATFNFSNAADVADVAGSAATDLIQLIGDLVTAAENGSLSPLDSKSAASLFTGTTALGPLADTMTIGLKSDLGSSAQAGAGGSVTIGAGAALVAQTTPEMLFFLGSWGKQSDPSSPGKATIELDGTVSTSASVGTVATLSAGASASAALLQLTVKEWDQARPSYQNVLYVFGFPVVGFTGQGGETSLPQGTGFLILPNTLGIGAVPVTLGVGSNGSPNDTWYGGLQFDNYTFSAASGTLDAQGLHWNGDISVLGSNLAFALTLNSTGDLSGNFSGSGKLDGWQLSQVTLNLASNGDFTGTAALSAGPFNIANAQIAIVNGTLQGQGDLTVGNVTVANAQFLLDSSGNLQGWGQISIGGLQLWSSFQANPTTGSFTLKGGTSANLNWSGSKQLQLCVNTFLAGTQCASASASLSASFNGRFNWSSSLNDGTVSLSAWIPNSQACGGGSASASIAGASVSGSAGPSCVTLSGVGGTIHLNAAALSPGCIIDLSILGMPFRVCPSFPIPGGSGYNHLSSSLTSGVGYAAAQSQIAATTTTAPTITIPPYTNDTSVHGSSAAGAAIVLYDGASQVGTATADAYGHWTVTGLTLQTGDSLTATAQRPGYAVSGSSAAVTVHAGQTPAPIIGGPVYNTDTSVSGPAAAGTVIVLYDDGRQVGTATPSWNGYWTVGGLTLHTGDYLWATAQPVGEVASSRSAAVTVQPGHTRAPFIAGPVYSNDTSVSGTSAAAGATIVLYDAINKSGATAHTVGTATADAKGNWTVTGLTLQAGHVVLASAQLPGYAKTYSVNAQIVYSAGQTPAPFIAGPVYANDTSVSGTSGASATIVLYDGASQAGTATAGANGNWTVTGLTLHEGDSLTATAQRPGYAVSGSSAAVTVHADQTPAPIIVSPVYTADNTIEGHAAAGTAIVLYDNGRQVGTTTTPWYGVWGVTGVTVQTGDSLTATAKLSGEAVSGSSAAVIVYAGPTSAPVIAGPVYTNETRVSGTSAGGAAIVLYDGASQAGTATAGANGNWTVKGLTLRAGDSLTATAQRPGYLVSGSSAAVTAQAGQTLSPIIAGPVYANETSVGGSSAAGAAIMLYDGASQVGTATAGANGNWTVTGLTLHEGDSLTATAQPVGEVTSSRSAAVTVQAGKTPAPVIVGPVYAKDTSVSGTSAADATIVLYDDASQVGTATAGADGNWTVTGLTLQTGDSLTATAKVSGDAVSGNSATVIVYAGQTLSPIIAGPVHANDTSVHGSSAAGAAIVLYDDASQVSTATYASADGNWTVAGLTLHAGDSLTATAQLPGYAVSGSSPAVTVQEAPAPAPVIAGPVYANDTSVGGTSAVNAAIVLYDNGRWIGAVTTGWDGVWGIWGLTLHAGDSLTATAKVSGDAVSGSSAAVIVYAGPTPAPVIAGPVYANETSVHGTSAAGAAIVLYDDASQVSTATYAGADGNWTVTGLTLKTGDSLTATAQLPGDAVSGNSAAVTVQPGQTPSPVIAGPVYANDTSVSGTAAASAAIVLYDDASQVSTATYARADGNWTVTGLTLKTGDSLTATAQLSGDAVSGSSAAVTVQAAQTPAPIIAGPVYANDTSVHGRSAVGAAIVLDDGASQVGTATAGANGNWTVTGLTLHAGDSLTATAQLSGEGVSGSSAAVTVQEGQTPGPIIAGPVYANGTSVSGTAAAGAAIVLDDDASQVGTATAGTNGNWTVAGLTLHAGDSLTATAQLPGEGASGSSAAVTVEASSVTPASTVSIGVSPESVPVGGTAQVFGTAGAGATVHLALSGGAASGNAGSLSSTTVTTDAHGDYSAVFTAPSQSGAVTVTATVSGVVDQPQAVILVTPPNVTVDGAEQAVATGGNATASYGNTSASGSGTGVLSVAEYATNPAGTGPAGGARYFDAALSTGNTFQSVTITECGATAGDTLYWLNPAANNGAGGWQAVNPAATYDAGCLSLTVNAHTSPSLSEMGGTVFAVAAAPAPVVTGLSPASGSVGTTVTIAGSGFSGATLVDFGTNPAQNFIVESAGEITAVAPAGTGTVDVTVVTSGGTSATGSANQFTYQAAPEVAGVSPASGSAGTTVTIAGSGFSGATLVDFGTNPAPSFTVESADGITAVAPAGTGTVDVTIVTSGGTSATGSADRFTYQAAPCTASFSDVPSTYWAHQAILTLACKGIIAGFPDGTFQPGAPVTRAQFAKMLVLTLGLKVGSGATSFADVPASAWFAPYVAAAVQAGIVDGLTPTTFGPNDSLTREQMAVLLARALKLTKTTTLHFSDDTQISAWAVAGVEEAVAAGYVGGFPDGSLQPLGAATRAQAAKVLALVLQEMASSGS